MEVFIEIYNANYHNKIAKLISSERLKDGAELNENFNKRIVNIVWNRITKKNIKYDFVSDLETIYIESEKKKHIPYHVFYEKAKKYVIIDVTCEIMKITDEIHTKER